MKKHLVLFGGFVLLLTGCSGNSEISIGEELNFQENSITVEKAELCDRVYPVDLITTIEGLFAYKEDKAQMVARQQDIIMEMSPLKNYPTETITSLKGEIFLILKIHNRNSLKSEEMKRVFGSLNAYLSDSTKNTKIKPVHTNSILFDRLPTYFLFNSSANIAAEQYASVNEKTIFLCFLIKKELLKGELFLMISGVDDKTVRIKIKNKGFSEIIDPDGKEFTTPDWHF